MKPNFRQENILWKQGYRLVAGVDEVGRGAWAGPIVAAAVVIREKDRHQQSWHKLVRDSKELSAKSREKLFDLVKSKIVWSVGVISNQVIDAKGLAVANKQVFIEAVKNLEIKPDFILTDFLANLGHIIADRPARSVVNGDAHIFSIALASVVAKVYRDRLMVEYETKYPGYGFTKHKGYGTKFHAAALAKLGPCLLHRQTYRPIKDSLL